MNLLALSDSDVIALSILSVGLAAFSVLVGGLFWILFKHGRKARFEAKIYEGLEDFSDEEGYQELTNSGKDDKPQLQEWERDADWWKK